MDTSLPRQPTFDAPWIESTGLVKRLADADRQEGRVYGALTHYQASLSGITKEHPRAAFSHLIGLGCAYCRAWGPGCELVHDIMDEEVIGDDPAGCLGRVARYRDHGRMASTDTHIAIARPNPDVIDPNYLYAYLRGAQRQYQLRSRERGDW